MGRLHHKHIEALQAGETVQYRPTGNSMVPIIKSHQLVTLGPVKLEEIEVGDVVLCKVYGRIFLHKVTAVRAQRFQISNNQGHVNGWTSGVFGRLVKVEP